MSCNCNNADPNCEPCAFCTPPGVKCLPDCDPKDPCEEKIDLCCVLNSGPDYPCSNIENGDPLCDLLLQFLEVEFPDSECCRLEMSIDLLAPTTTTTTTTTSSTTTTTTRTPTTTTTTSTTSTTTTTTATPGLQSVQLCKGNSCLLACACDNEEPSTYYVASSSILQNSTIYTNNTGTVYATPGYYSNGVSCFHVTGSLGKVTTVTPCIPYGKIEINLEGLSGDIISNVTYNGIPVVPTSGSFPLTNSVAFMTALVSNPGNLGTLKIYQNISVGDLNIIQTIVTDANGTLFCQNPVNGLVNYEFYNIDINMNPTTVFVQYAGTTC